MIKLTKLYHQIIAHQAHIHVAVDMTCGHGHDTLFLAKHAKKVYAFDIQSIAIEETKARLKDYQHIVYVLDNHEHVSKYVHEPIDLAIYNLGYLPGYHHHVMTQASSTIQSIKSTINLLSETGMIIIEVYPHNDQEMSSILAFTKSLPNEVDVIKIDLHNKENAPKLVIIKK